jgi:hypothetical protein
VVAALVCAVADVVVTRAFLGSWDPGSFVALALIAVLGFVSIKLEDSVYFKLQPVVLSVLFAGLVAYHQFWGTPIVQVYLPLIKKAAPPGMQHVFGQPAFLALLDGMVTWSILALLLHGAAVAYTALRASNLVWLLTRALGFWVIGFAVSFGYMALH